MLQYKKREQGEDQNCYVILLIQLAYTIQRKFIILALIGKVAALSDVKKLRNNSS